MNDIFDSYQEKNSGKEKEPEESSSLKAAAVELPKGGDAINSTSSSGILIPPITGKRSYQQYIYRNTVRSLVRIHRALNKPGEWFIEPL
jgi:hypothetical protein